MLLFLSKGGSERNVLHLYALMGRNAHLYRQNLDYRFGFGLMQISYKLGTSQLHMSIPCHSFLSW